MMKMIDVMKRLAELDAKNPNMVREGADLAECGPMGMMDGMGGMGQSHSPASINMTAATGDELSGMLKDIMSLAGLNKVGPDDLGMEPEPTVMTAEPVTAVGPAATDSDMMRSVIDKLNPELDGGDDQGGDDQGGMFGGGDEQGDADQGDDGVSKAHGDIDGDGDHDMDDHDAEKDDEPEDESQYDNSPADPTKPPAFGSNNFAKQDNPQGGGNDEEGKKRVGTQPTATFENLMKEYKKFIGEAKDEEADEGIEDRLKDLDPKNPVNIPAYKRKAASGDSADAARNTKEEKEEWHPSKHVTDPQKKKELAPHDKDVKRGSYADRAAYLKAAGVPQSESANESMAAMLKLAGLTK
jgi:hypothetical protein